MRRKGKVDRGVVMGGVRGWEGVRGIEKGEREIVEKRKGGEGVFVF